MMDISETHRAQKKFRFIIFFYLISDLLTKIALMNAISETRRTQQIDIEVLLFFCLFFFFLH